MFKKVKEANGKRTIYLFGHKIFTYNKKHKKPSMKYFAQYCTYYNPVEYIRSLGVKVGENTQFVIYPHFFSYPNLGSEPYLIEIGENVLCSFGVTFLTHDGSAHTCKQYLEKGTQLSNFGRIKIGNNSFIGCNVTILRGVTIGNNCIIGAGSVVTKNVPDGEVWAGNPAKFIKKTEDVAKSYYEK